MVSLYRPAPTLTCELHDHAAQVRRMHLRRREPQLQPAGADEAELVVERRPLGDDDGTRACGGWGLECDATIAPAAAAATAAVTPIRR